MTYLMYLKQIDLNHVLKCPNFLPILLHADTRTWNSNTLNDVKMGR